MENHSVSPGHTEEVALFLAKGMARTCGINEWLVHFLMKIFQAFGELQQAWLSEKCAMTHQAEIGLQR